MLKDVLRALNRLLQNCNHNACQYRYGKNLSFAEKTQRNLGAHIKQLPDSLAELLEWPPVEIMQPEVFPSCSPLPTVYENEVKLVFRVVHDLVEFLTCSLFSMIQCSLKTCVISLYV